MFEIACFVDSFILVVFCFRLVSSCISGSFLAFPGFPGFGLFDGFAFLDGLSSWV